MIVVVLCLVSVVGIGLLYSRATLIITEKKARYTDSKSIQISTIPRNGAVHGVWIVQTNANSVAKSVYPEYVPLMEAPTLGTSLVVSRRDLIKSISNDMYNQYSELEFFVDTVTIDSVVLDEFAFISKPSEFPATVSLSIGLRSIVDSQDVSTKCAYTYIVMNTNSLENCLRQFSGIESARLTIHPWFAFRTPISRAFDVSMQN